MELFGKKISEALDKAKNTVEKSVSNIKKLNEEVAEAKAPVEGAIARYCVSHREGFPKQPRNKMDATTIGLNIMEDSFIFKPEAATKKQWFGDENFVVPYKNVKEIQIVKRAITTSDMVLASDVKSLQQENTIHILYTDENGNDLMLKMEMMTGATVYTQAAKCQEMMDLLKQKGILDKFTNSKKENNSSGGTDVLEQIEKLAKMKESGLLTEEEFNAKKAELLERL